MIKFAFPWKQSNRSNIATRHDRNGWIVCAMLFVPNLWVAKFLDREDDQRIIDLGYRYDDELHAKEACDQFLITRGYRILDDKWETML